jgi:hypothetical protein
LPQKSVYLGFIRALLIRVMATWPEVHLLFSLLTSLRVKIAPLLHLLMGAPLLIPF